MVYEGFGLTKELLGEKVLTLMLGWEKQRSCSKFHSRQMGIFYMAYFHAPGGISDNTWSYFS